MIKSITLSNWKSHASSQLEFQDGTNVLVGNMGAGKSSVLQAISFALFGTFSELKSRGLKTSEVISRTADSHVAEIELKIKSRIGLLTIHRRIDAKKNATEATVRDENNKLLAGPLPTAVNDFLRKTLNIDEAIFLRAVYGMQNEIDGILRLSPNERKKRVDELMGLDRFETARKSAGKLKTKIQMEFDISQKIIHDLKSENINAQENALSEELSKLIREQQALSEELIRKEQQEKINKVELEHMRADAKALDLIINRIKVTKSQINEMAVRLMGVELNQNLVEIEQKEQEFQSQIEKLSVTKSNLSKSLSEKNVLLVDVERNVAVSESRVKSLLNSLSEFQKAELELESLKSQHGISDLRQEVLLLNSEIKSKDEQIKINLANMESLRRHLEELISMAGLCPLCKTNLSEQNRNSLISSIKKELAELLYENNKASHELDKLKQNQSKLEKLSEKYNKNIERLENKEKTRTEKYQEDAVLEKLKSERSSIKADIFRFENLLKDTELEISSLSTKRDNILKTKHLYDLKNRKSHLEFELQKLESEEKKFNIDQEKLRKCEEEFQIILRRVQEIRTRSEGLSSLLQEKRLRLKELKDKKLRMMKLENNLKALQNKIEFLDKFKNALQATQLELRDDLILTVNEVMGSVWLEIYPYSIWSGVRLAVNENDYILQIKDSENDWVNVTGFASGGERMLATLAMRISFARVMVPSLSLLILDEPTHNLDEKAVQTLIEVVQERVSDFIDQILIVTHEEKLAESASNIIRLNS